MHVILIYNQYLENESSVNPEATSIQNRMFEAFSDIINGIIIMINNNNSMAYIDQDAKR